MGWKKRIGMAAASVVLTANVAAAQNWDVSVYPVLVWVPLGIDINVDVPPFEGGGGGIGDIIDGRFDGAYLGGVSATNGKIRIDADGIWAAVGGDRIDTPVLSVDVDLIYFHGSVGYAVVPNLFVTGGVRRFAVDYSIKFGSDRSFDRKPGFWDPVVGVGYHRIGNVFDVHGVFETGGFGVGTDIETNAALRFDFKLARHFGLTLGYNVLYFKASDDDGLPRVFEVKQTLHGPVFGFGLYF